ncbi:MAG TPA: methionine biosynthesis protein MetW [Marmoricola sp.]|nr:methionine biosynthesis protein MetW [Marmoricola sp.]HNO39846.1 methionine biosynthesis protein MetW [Marmoricola sp.]
MRPDLEVVAELVAPGSRVLDLGCGDGELLAYLEQHRDCTGTGVDTDPDSMISAIRQGVSVIDLDIDTQLDEFADHSYDIVVLSQTLQATRHPAQILAQIERIAGLGVVSVPNFAHWRNRLSLAVTGRMPVSQALPYRWQDTPNIHLSSLRDLEHLFADLQLQVLNRVTLDPEGHQVKGALRGGPANLLAAGAAYLVATSSPVGNAGQG